MRFETLKKHLLKKPSSFIDHPFGDDVPVFKVKNKLFALVSLQKPLAINLKCDPEDAEILRKMWDAVQPGYHMNKLHWNTVTLDGSIPKEIVFGFIDDSYDLVVKGLSKKDRQSL